MVTEKRIGVVGLGNMGLGMATSLIRNNYTVVGVDLNESQKRKAIEIGVDVVENIRSLCQKIDTIILSLPMAKHVQEVIQGEGGICQYASENTLVIDTSTSEPDVTKTLATDLHNKGHTLLDCPVSGGPSGASSGTMVMLVGGDAEKFASVKSVLDCLTSKIVYLGESGNGHAAKLINNLLCASHLIIASEALAIGEKLGLSPEQLIEGINAGSGRSAVTEINYPCWILNDAFDSGFSMQLMRKDIALATKQIEASGLSLPASRQMSKRWAQSKESIADEKDFNCIVDLVKDK